MALYKCCIIIIIIIEAVKHMHLTNIPVRFGVLGDI